MRITSLTLAISLLSYWITHQTDKKHSTLHNLSPRPSQNYDHTQLHCYLAAYPSLLHRLKHKTIKPSCTYIFILLLSISADTELNPGPRTPRYPCGTCNKAVTWKSSAICCDSCNTWYHVDCQGMNPSFLKYMDHSGVSWDCIQCGLPNFSSTLFDNNTSINTSNRFSQLDTDTDLNTQNIPTSPGPPTASSSPIKHNKDVTRKNKFNQPIRIATINFQSISNKKPDLEQILHSLKPDIIIGTETWLNNTTSSYEYFPIQEYTVYRKDRKQNKKGQSHGGVLIAVTNKYRSEQIQELDTDNESIFINISMANSHNLTIGSYYRPPSDKGHSLDQLEISMKRLGHNNNTITFISGDFNLPHIDWQNNTTIPGKTDTKLHQQLLDIIDDNSLTQMTTNTTRGDHILDLTLTNRPSIVNKTETSPPIGKADHDIIFTEIDVRLKKIRKQPRDIPLYGKANWDNIRNDLTHINTKLDEPTNQTIDDLWNLFKNTLNDSVD
ncbi:uncharacterized protein [Argopecten irradians]|uniref:uncharacterized protein n=1 Tax=Argopecten irradians TaxID=31199 RepID=UPI003711C740